MIAFGTPVVRVKGDVRHPGIYPITANMVTDSVIKMAELRNTLKRYVPEDAGRQPLTSGTDIQVTMNPDGSVGIIREPIPMSQRMVLGVPLDINLMGIDDFDRLPGIGPVLAQRIVSWRQLNGGIMRLEDLLLIEGVGDTMYHKLKKFF